MSNDQRTVCLNGAAWYRLGDVMSVEMWTWIAEKEPTPANQARAEQAVLAQRGLSRLRPGTPVDLPAEEADALLDEARWHLALLTPADLAAMFDSPLKEDAQRRRIQLEAAIEQLAVTPA